MINGVTLQCNDIRSQMNNSEGGTQRSSLLDNPRVTQGESSVSLLNESSFRYSTKLDFPRFNEDGWRNGFLRLNSFCIR